MTQSVGDDYRLSYERQGDDLILQMGPQHPSTHGVLRLELVLDGEVVKAITPHIGYLHRCFEKHAEALTYPQVIPYTDRMDYLAAMSMELGYVLAVEKLIGLTELPERLQYIRIIMAELFFGVFETAKKFSTCSNGRVAPGYSIITSGLAV
jgi:NADH:ubiquinone oxidoreductase subunit D